jgi:hypothetical protein
MSITQQVIEGLARHVQQSIAEIGKALGDQNEEEFEAALLLLQELNHFRSEVIKLRERFPPISSSSLDQLLQRKSHEPVLESIPVEAPVEAPVEEPVVEAAPIIEEENFEARRADRGNPPRGRVHPCPGLQALHAACDVQAARQPARRGHPEGDS